MLRLSLRALLLITVLSAAIFIARMIGKAQPAPSLFSVIFTNPDGSPCEMPCMFGVRPGKMTAKEKARILRSHPATRNMLETHSSESNYYFEAEGVFLVVDSQIETLELKLNLPNNSHGTPPSTKWLLDEGTFGDVVSTLGPPRSIHLMGNNPYETFSLAAEVPITQAFYPNDRFTTVFIFKREVPGYISPSDPLDVIVILPSSPADKSWRGFGSVSSYYSMP